MRNKILDFVNKIQINLRLFAMEFGKRYEFRPIIEKSSGSWKKYGNPIGIPTFNEIHERDDHIQRKMETIALSQKIDPKRLGFQMSSAYKGQNGIRAKIQPYIKG